MPTLMQDSIGRAVTGTRPGTLKRMHALASVRWVLATEDGRFVAVDDRAKVFLTDDAKLAAIFDGRDNEELKCRFMETLLSVQLTVVLLDE